MRKLNTGDIIQAARIFKKIDIRDQISSIYFDAQKNIDPNNEEEVNKAGFNAFWSIFMACLEEKVEYALYDLLARPFQCTAEEVESMELEELESKLIILVKENNIARFLKNVWGMKA